MPRVKDSERQTIGEWLCEGCGATVQLYINKAGRAYYGCTGKHDSKFCGHMATFGYAKSRSIVQEFKQDAETAETAEKATEANPGTVSPGPDRDDAATNVAAGRGLLCGIREYVSS